MNAINSAIPSPAPTPSWTLWPRGIAILRTVLIAEALLTLAAAVVLSMLAAALSEFLGGSSGRAAEETVRFVAAFAFLVAVAGAVTARGARRARPWAWTAAAVLQLIVAGATAVAVLVAPWHSVYVAGFVLPAIGMLAVSAPSVRRTLGQP
ncbi:MAG: hypothetical protein ACR2K4_02330 [Candidatus Limnocylindria bacterium]